MNSPRKRIVKKVSLRFFEDDANGEYGLAHADTIENNGSDGFNAFWGAMGIFHDIFEHSHEHSRFFRGENAMNVGGEMAAMGALWYYRDELGFYKRLPDGAYYSGSQNMMRTTLDMITEAIECGNTQFGDVLRCGVPKQKETDNSELECICEEYAAAVRATVPNKYGRDDAELCEAYKASVTAEKIADLHRWGFREAQKLVPHTWENHGVISNFWDTWEKFCKQNSAEEMASLYRGVEVKIYRTGSLVSWKAEFIPHVGSDESVEKIVLQG